MCELWFSPGPEANGWANRWGYLGRRTNNSVARPAQLQIQIFYEWGLG